MMVGPLTLKDIALLYDGVRDDLPRGLSARLSWWIRRDRQFADQVRQLEEMASEAGLAPDAGERMSTACGLARDLDRLLAAESWSHPAEVLDPGRELGLDLPGLARLAESVSRRDEPPAGIESVRARIEAALEQVRTEEALVDAFVDGLLSQPERARALLRSAIRTFEDRIRGSDS